MEGGQINPSAYEYSDDDEVISRSVEYVESSYDQEDSNDSDGEVAHETDELLISNMIEQDVLYRTRRDITIFTYCFILHSVIVEAPLCVLESLIRCFIFFLLSLFLLFIYFLSLPVIGCKAQNSSRCSTSPFPPLLRSSALCFLESILSFALGLSLSIPCCILLIYRDFNGVDDWNLHSVPSLLGWIDPRRLAMISLGQGASARNSSFTQSPFGPSLPQNCQEEMMDTIIPPPALVPIDNNPSLFTSPLCFPREILLFLRSR
jgi:hypothetical protein